jgi:hypothetical protein
MRFKFDASALYKDQVAMLDILSNFDWTRNIYFSSPYASEVGKALLRAGYVAMEGTVFKLTPVRGLQVNNEKMYENLMKDYSYGNMGEKGVLVDYYARRHATQFRHFFYVLASQYAQEYDNLKNGANSPLADSTQNKVIDQKALATAREKVVAVVEKAMNSMPLRNVLDYGEPNSQKQQSPSNPNDYTYDYSDGTVHEFVNILYRVDATEAAAKLGNEVATRLESIMDFVLDSPIEISAGIPVYFFSALDAYSLMFSATPDAKNDTFAQHLENYIKSIQPRFNKMLNAMKNADAGKVREERVFQEAVNEYTDRMQRMPLFATK